MTTTPWKDYIGKRVLLQSIDGGDVFEATLIETTSSGSHIRLQNLTGGRDWKKGDQYEVVEELPGGLVEEMRQVLAQQSADLQSTVETAESLRVQVRELSAALAQDRDYLVQVEETLKVRAIEAKQARDRVSELESSKAGAVPAQ